jgi:hypothetical protein
VGENLFNDHGIYEKREKVVKGFIKGFMAMVKFQGIRQIEFCHSLEVHVEIVSMIVLIMH